MQKMQICYNLWLNRGKMLPEISAKAWFGIASIIIGIIGYVPYFVGLYQKKLKPHVFTWFLWGFLMAIVWLGQMQANAGAGAWITGMSAFFCLVIAVVALKIGDKDITRSDWICFIAGLLGIPIWYFTKDPLYAILFLTLIDCIAFIPTLRKLWSNPSGESALSYAITLCKFVISILAIREFNLATVIYPAALIVMNVILVSSILLRHKAIAKTMPLAD